MIEQPLISTTFWPYFQKLLNYHNLEFYPTCKNPNQHSGHQQKIKNFDQYNSLLDINLCFSDRPGMDVRDRTKQTKMPFNLSVRPWIEPVSVSSSIEETFELRVKEISLTSQKINILWSGGIDSTAIVVAFLKHYKSLDQLRIIHSVMSRKENPYFFLLLQQYPQIEIIEMGGDFYMEKTLDGIFVTGGAGDDLLASLDESFFQKLGWVGLNQSWKNFFFKKNKNVEFINYCEEFFSRSKRPIDTVLEARWWFYMICKMHPQAHSKGVLTSGDALEVSFFNSQKFDDYIYFNTDKLLPGKTYNSYKKFIKDYILDFDKNNHYNKYKQKENSSQLHLYKIKKNILQNTQPIMYLSDGTCISVDALPFLSQSLYRQKYGDSLNYLFNTQ
jgi:hypothetical protein